MSPIIIVHYLAGDIAEFDKRVQYFRQGLAENPLMKNVFCYFIPTEEESRVECINPQLLTEEYYQEAKRTLDKCTELLKETVKNG